MEQSYKETDIQTTRRIDSTRQEAGWVKYIHRRNHTDFF